MFVTKFVLFETLYIILRVKNLNFRWRRWRKGILQPFVRICAPPKRHQRGSLWFSLVALLLAFGGAEGAGMAGYGPVAPPKTGAGATERLGLWRRRRGIVGASG